MSNKSVKVLRKGGNPNVVKDWELCSGDPTCPRHVHLQKTVSLSADSLNDIIDSEVEQDVQNFVNLYGPSLAQKNVNENALTVATIFSSATVALASGGGAVYIADAFAGGPVPFQLAFGLAVMFGAMGGVFSGVAAYYTHSRTVRKNKAASLAKKYELETGAILSKREKDMFFKYTSFNITDSDHMQNQHDMMAAQAEANRKFLEEYNAPSQNR